MKVGEISVLAVRNQIAKYITAILLISFIQTVPGSFTQIAQAAYGVGLTNCENTNNLRIAASHGKAFYIDSSINPKIDAGYVGYQIYNNSGSTKTGLWLKLSDFVGGKVGISNIEDQYMQIDDIANNDTKTVYVLLKASGVTTTEQSHLVEIFNKRPDLTGASKQTSCRYAFSAVKETIKASANKLENNGGSAITTGVEVSKNTVTLGETITVTVEGAPGQIGKGAAPDYDTIYLTPAGISSWPTRALKLIKVDIKFDRNDSGWAIDPQYVDRLIISSANGLDEVDMGSYVVRYTFQVIGNPGSSVRVAPVAQIASGTQMKHTDLGAFGSTTITFSSFTIPQTIQKGITSSTNLETGTASTIAGATAGLTYVAIPYVETITSTSSSTFTIDEIVDKPSTSAIFYTGSATITDATRTNVTISDPTYIASEASLSPRPIHFIGPFQGSSARTVILRYKMWLPANGSTYSNTAYAEIGDQKIGASASAIPKVDATTGNGTGTITVVVTTESLVPEVLTNPATNIDTTVATMNATVDPNANAGTIKFQYGTSPSLASYTQVTATSPASGAVTVANSDPLAASYDLNGLNSGTTFYFRVVIDSSTTRLATGAILSFITSVPVAAPTVTTNNADSITASTSPAKVRLNGTINPNNTSLNYLYFQYSELADFSGATTNEVEINDGEASPTALTAGGPSAMSFSMYVISGLSVNKTYYYRIVGCTTKGSGVSCASGAGNSTYAATSVTFSTLSTNQNQTITFNTVDNKTYGATGVSSTANSTSKLTVTVTSLTTSKCTVSNSVAGVDTTTTTTITIVEVGDCILEATQTGGTIGGITYNAAAAVQVSFSISPATIIVTASDKTRTTTQSVGTFTATLSAGAAKYSDSISFSTAVYLFSGKESTSYATSSTQPDSSTVGTYSITPSAPELTFTPSSAAINYQITTVDGTYTIAATGTTYTVTYNVKNSDNTNPTSGTAPSDGSSPYASATTVTVIGNTGTLVLTGYTFAGWCTTNNNANPRTCGGNTYTSGSTFGISSNINLYALWNQNQTVTLANSTVTYGSTANVSTLLTDGAGSGAVTYSVTAGASGCSITSTTLTALIATGTCTVQASKASGGGYNAATGTATITLSQRLITLKATDQSKTVGQSDPSLTSFSITSGSLYSSDTVTAITASRNAGETVGTYTISISAETFSPTSISDSYTVTRATGVFTINAEGTYSITINSATGGSGSSSAATVSSGGSVTLTATASGSYTFASWSCTGGGTLSSATANPATLSNITANATCTPTFTLNSTNTGGGGAPAGGIGRSGNKIVVAKVTNTQPSSVVFGSKSTFTGTSTTLTPGNSANKTSVILPTAATETTKAGGVIAVVTNTSAVSTPFNANKSAVSQGVALVNAASTTAISELEKRVELPASVKIERDGERGIQVSANNGWTGRVSVSVMNGNSDSDVETFVEIVITPTAITAPKILQEQPTAIQKVGETPKPGLVVTWAPSQSEVVGYIVTVNSQPTCFTMTTSCEINQLIGPKTKVAVIAQGNDNTFSTSAPLPAFKPTRPVPALVVNFAVASSILSPKFKADLRDLAKVMVKAGFTKVDIAGHTDSTGQEVGYDNQQLSDARAKATLTYLKRFVPKLKSVTGAYAYERRITDESTTEALYVNRRAEVAVS